MIEATAEARRTALDLLSRFAAESGVERAELTRIEEAVRTCGDLGARPLPLQRPAFYVAGLTARPWHDPAAFVWTAGLEAAAPEVDRELQRLLEEEGFGVHPEVAELARAGYWHQFHLYNHGEEVPGARRRCPLTARAVDAVPGAATAGLVYLSAATPGTHIAPHCGPHNARLRCHLGLRVPPGCWLRVGDETRSWQEGRCLVFDDSFEHEVHVGDATRIVLIVDFWHPDLSRVEIDALGFLMRETGFQRDRLKRIEASPRAWWQGGTAG